MHQHPGQAQRLVPDSNPRKVYKGRRGTADPVYRLTRLDTLARAPFRLERLWEPLRSALRLPKALVHWLGDLVQWRASAAPGGRP